MGQGREQVLLTSHMVPLGKLVSGLSSGLEWAVLPQQAALDHRGCSGVPTEELGTGGCLCGSFTEGIPDLLDLLKHRKLKFPGLPLTWAPPKFLLNK